VFSWSEGTATQRKCTNGVEGVNGKLQLVHNRKSYT